MSGIVYIKEIVYKLKLNLNFERNNLIKIWLEKLQSLLKNLLEMIALYT